MSRSPGSFPPHAHRGAHQGAHHAVAERIRLQLGHKHAVGVALPAEVEEVPDGRGTVTRTAVGGPVVQAEQFLGGVVHAGDVEVGRVPEGVEAPQGSRTAPWSAIRYR